MSKRRPAFTLIEVMVGVLILSLAASGLFTGQVFAIGATHYVKHVVIATQLARCRMSEIEIDILREGFEIAEFEDWEEGPCCELRDDNVRTPPGGDPFTCRWRMENVTMPSMADTQNEVGDAMMEGNQEAVAGAASMSLLGPLLPQVQQLLEQAIRKVTVQVVWTEGENRHREVELVQFLTNANQGALGSTLRNTDVQRRLEEETP